MSFWFSDNIHTPIVCSSTRKVAVFVVAETTEVSCRGASSRFRDTAAFASASNHRERMQCVFQAKEEYFEEAKYQLVPGAYFQNHPSS